MIIPGMMVHVHERQQELSAKGVEYIDSVAIVRNGRTYRLYWPCRHCHIAHMLYQCEKRAGEETEVQGFMTNRDRFVDRTDAATLARNNAQTVAQGDELYSEDLW